MEKTPSETAFRVMQLILATARRDAFRGTVPAEDLALIRTMMRSNRRGRRLAARAERPLGNLVVRWLERRVAPGVGANYIFRKRFMESRANALLPGRTSHLFYIGAGLDILPLKLARGFPALQVVEIDRPAFSAVKRDALAAVGPLPANLTLIAADLLERRVAEICAEAAAGRPIRAPLFVCEGLLMYFPEAFVRAFFRQIAEAAPDAHLLFTIATPHASDDNDGTDRMHAHLRTIGEPFRWQIARDRIGGFLESVGFALIETDTALAMFRRMNDGAAPATVHRGEVFVAARAGLGQETAAPGAA